MTLRHGPKRELPTNDCPLCRQKTYFRFPDDFPTIKQLNARYAHSVLEQTTGNKAAASRILGVAYRTLCQKIDTAVPDDDVRPVSSEDRTKILVSIENSEPLRPIGSPGACNGVFSLVASNARASIYEIRFNDSVVGASEIEDIAAGHPPKIMFVEADDSERYFEFGKTCDQNCYVVVIPVRKRLVMAVVIGEEQE